MNVLAIGAHFDDIELGCGGTLAKHVEMGDRVFTFVAADSGFSNQHNEEVRSSEAAKSEGARAMSILGVEKVFCGGFPTMGVEFIDSLNVQIIRIVEKCGIELVYTHWAEDAHHDHRALARASFHSCRHVPRVLTYRSNWYHSSSFFHGTYYVDITKYWETKERAIRAYETEMKRTNWVWIKYFRNEAENAGRRVGVECAEVFEVVKWLSL